MAHLFLHHHTLLVGVCFATIQVKPVLVVLYQALLQMPLLFSDILQLLFEALEEDLFNFYEECGFLRLEQFFRLLLGLDTHHQRTNLFYDGHPHII